MQKASEMMRGGLRKLSALVLKVFGIYLAATIACVVLAAPFVDYSCARLDIVQYGVPLFLLAVVACGLIIALYSQLKDREFGTGLFCALVFGMALALFVVQLYLEKSAGFRTAWDVGQLIQVGDCLPSDLAGLESYFSTYPNQLFLYGLFHKIGTLSVLIGMSTYRALVRCGCLCVTVSIVLATFACERLFGKARALVFQVVASLFLGTNAWVLVPYSDAYGMLFTCAALWFYVVPRHRPVRLFGMTAASLLGYMVKPTAIFLLFAVACLDWLSRAGLAVRGGARGKRNAGRRAATLPSCDASSAAGGPSPASTCSRSSRAPRARASRPFMRNAYGQLLSIVAPIVLGAVLAVGLGHYVQGNYLKIDEGASRGMTHFLAMGINPDRKGVWSADDNEYSASFGDPDERRAAQLDLWKKRIFELGPIGIAKIWFQKNLTNYADGTFAWKMEAGNNFVLAVSGDSPAVKSWFGIGVGEQSDYPSTAYGWYCQIFWLAVLTGCAASALRRARSAEPHEASELADAACDARRADANGPAGERSDEAYPMRSANHICDVMALALIFLSGFLLIFECRARYLFLFSPYYVLLAIDGLVGVGSAGERLADKIDKLFGSRHVA